ncbi:hypothetical protein FLL45_01720 [Aliikangiella marina]|uniref:Thioredoxin family protein n=1 Tax=Aliikangiella marina TaxID=1712262 RepID=A0A545THJ6_9GAMM|nr:hypothetical protein [Aliikangiella marina]TQV76704.1 hypothetical protein FLL45_01720 [Aliikangiella marina]
MKNILVVIFCLVFANVSIAGDEKTVLPEFQYLANDNALESIKAKQLRAKTSGKLLLVALGGEWCHDSRGLGQRFSDPELTTALKTQYEIEFVDVGYLDKAFEVANYFGQDAYWGTPSVLIINPESGKVINRDSVWHWTNADSLDISEYKTYFLEQSFIKKTDSPSTELANALYQGYLKQIKQFESQQTAKLKSAYQVVGPLLKDYKESGQKASQQFIKTWDEVREFRVAYSKDINELYQIAKSNSQKGIKERLTFPSYDSFSWE